MLSLLYSLVDEFRARHGCLPNLVYLSSAHYHELRAELPQLHDHEALARYLALEFVISNDSPRPRVAWIRPRHLRRAASGW